MDNKNTRVLLALLLVGTLMGAIDLAIIGPALPAIQAEFGMQQRQLASLLNAYVLFQMIGALVLAKMADRLGPRAIYIFSLTLFAAGSLVLVLANDVFALNAGRAIQGFGAGGIFPAGVAVIGTRLPPDERGPALGILGMVWGLAFLVGPILGGILLRFAWQWLFLINLPIAAVLIVGAVRLLPAASIKKTQPYDVAGTIVLSVALAALTLAVSELDTGDLVASLLTPAIGSALLIAGLLVPMFWFIEKRAADPVVQPRLFASGQIVKSCTISAGVGALQAAGIFYPALAVVALDVSAANAALLLIPGVIASTIASPIVGKLINPMGTRSIVIISMLLVIACFLVYGFAPSLGLTSFIVASILSGLGMAGLLGAPLRFIVLNASDAEDRAAAQGLLSVLSSVGRLLGAAFVGAVATSRGGGMAGYQAAFIGMAALGVALLLLSYTLKSRAAEQLDNAAAAA